MAWRWLLLTAVSAEDQPLCHGSFRSLEEGLHDFLGIKDKNLEDMPVIACLSLSLLVYLILIQSFRVYSLESNRIQSNRI